MAKNRRGKSYDDGGSGLRVKVDNMQALLDGVRALGRDEVLVGVPEENTGRDDPESKAAGITNASLAYIHDNGAPEQNIPARPFMVPGMELAKDKVVATMMKMAQYALAGDADKVDQGYDRIGFAAVSAITGVIRAGIAPELSPVTLRKRAAKGRKGAQAELNRRAAGYGPSLQLATPLMDTNEMLKSITYVKRARKDRRK